MDFDKFDAVDDDRSSGASAKQLLNVKITPPVVEIVRVEFARDFESSGNFFSYFC